MASTDDIDHVEAREPELSQLSTIPRKMGFLFVFIVALVLLVVCIFVLSMAGPAIAPEETEDAHRP